MPELPTETFSCSSEEGGEKPMSVSFRHMKAALLFISARCLSVQVHRWVYIRQRIYVCGIRNSRRYFKGGFSTNPYVIIREFDRTAPYGTSVVTKVESMPPVCVPIRKHRTWATLASSIWMPKKRNTSMSAVPPTSLVSKTIRISLNHLPSCLPLLTRAWCNWQRIWV